MTWINSADDFINPPELGVAEAAAAKRPFPTVQALLAALPDGALVVNVGRGPLIDTDALVRHVRSGRLRAALDVTDPEPLPADHPLWSAPGVIVSPHVGGVTEAFRPRAVAMIRSQLARLAAGGEPEHLVRRPG